MKTSALLAVLAFSLSSCGGLLTPSVQGRWEGDWKLDGIVSVVQKQRLYITDNGGQLTARLQEFNSINGKWENSSKTFNGNRKDDKISLVYSGPLGATHTINGTFSGNTFNGIEVDSSPIINRSGNFSFTKASSSADLLPTAIN